MMLEAKNAIFSYPGQGDRPVFSNIDFSVKRGEVLCILGPNGVGKTTLLKCIAGLHGLRTGEILLEGRPVSIMKRAEAARVMSYVPQIHQPVFSYTVFDTVLMGRTPHLGLFQMPGEKDRETALKAIEGLGIGHLANRPYTEISGGERQLVLFARVLCQQPRVLLLDEPTSHLDFGNQVHILSLIRRLAAEGLTVVMTSHFPDHAFLTSGKVLMMRSGRVFGYGTPEVVVTESGLREVFGVDVEIITLESGARVCVPRITGDDPPCPPPPEGPVENSD